MADPLERIATALERLVELAEEDRRDRASRRRGKGAPAPEASLAPDVVVDELTQRRAKELLTKRGLGRARPKGKR